MTDQHAEKAYYVTTPIYYVNDRPHIGSALTTLCCDMAARYQRLRGRRAWFLTGTDENATKVVEAAKTKGLEVAEMVERLASDFRTTWDALHIAYDDFIRTTEPRHIRAVEEVFTRLQERGYIYEDLYEGWYSVSDETFFRDSDVRDGVAIETGKPVVRVQERNYFFRLSAFGDRLLEHIEANPGFLQPEFRKNEVVSFIRQGLRDMCITRNYTGWGIRAPGAPDKAIYVWFDALINYLAATGWPDDEANYRRLWPADVHMMGKEIFVRFHATLWPAMLMGLDLPLPRTVVAHGWWVAPGGEKLGKSTGGLPHPVEYAAELQAASGAEPAIAVDALRYLLLREMVFHGDTEFSRTSFLRRYNADLANDLGNLTNRTVTMVARYFEWRVPAGAPSAEIGEAASAALRDYEAAMEEFRFHSALEAVWRLISRTNRFIQERKPWELARDGRTAELADTLVTCLEAVRVAAVMVAPAMPAASDALRRQIGDERPPDKVAWSEAAAWGAVPAGTRLADPFPLFPRIAEEAAAAAVPPKTPKERPSVQERPASEQPAVPAQEQISIEDFLRIQLRVGTVTAAERVPNADKLLKLTVDLGDETRTIVAGIAEMYEPDEVAGKQVVIVANLAPRKMRGIESQGMLLAADVEGQAILLHPETAVPPGARVR
jgi:methionyl-tRNA synthetase